MLSDANQTRTTTLCLIVEKDRVPAFFSILAQGFVINTKVGCSVRELLCVHMGLGEDYLEQRLQTIFLDGKAVDNTETAMVHQGSTLALSAAMPGLAGATLRRGSAYSAMRDQITHKKSTKNEGIIKDGTIRLKLFNLVAQEIGQLFLTQGIQIDGRHLINMFRRASNQFWSGCRIIEMNGRPIDAEKLMNMDWKPLQVFLKLDIV
ncbi:hypothetical protein ACFL0O_07770 [Thermodesulfobacteriota bacterium]